MQCNRLLVQVTQNRFTRCWGLPLASDSHGAISDLHVTKWGVVKARPCTVGWQPCLHQGTALSHAAPSCETRWFHAYGDNVRRIVKRTVHLFIMAGGQFTQSALILSDGIYHVHAPGASEPASCTVAGLPFLNRNGRNMGTPACCLGTWCVWFPTREVLKSAILHLPNLVVTTPQDVRPARRGD